MMKTLQELLASRPPKPQVRIQLSNAEYDQFIRTCNVQHIPPTRLKQATQLLDKEGF
jgi:hypothetical protein